MIQVPQKRRENVKQQQKIILNEKQSKNKPQNAERSPLNKFVTLSCPSSQQPWTAPLPCFARLLLFFFLKFTHLRGKYPRGLARISDRFDTPGWNRQLHQSNWRSTFASLLFDFFPSDSLFSHTYSEVDSPGRPSPGATANTTPVRVILSVYVWKSFLRN